MDLLEQIKFYIFQYYGVDWLITLLTFVGIFLIGDKNKKGFIFGMSSSLLALVFSFQIGSIANGVTAIFLFGLYLRGLINWVKVK
ncbi:MAG: PnuC protein [Candidatus Uhrbacteria bacterium]